MTIKYDKKYYEGLKQQHNGTAKLINEIRWEFVKDIPFNTVLDYGCGCGELTTFAPQREGLIIDSYDIGMLNGEPYPQTGILHDRYDLTFFNDVIEHVDWVNNPDANMLHAFQNTTYISVSIPVWNGKIEDIKTWKHYKPGEHLYYFSSETLMDFFIKKEMKLIKKGYPECPPRQDIFSAIFTTI